MRLFGSEYSSQRWYYSTICTPFILFLAFILASQDTILDSRFAEIPWYVVAIVIAMFLSVLVYCTTSFFGMLWYGDPEVQNIKNVDTFERSGWDKQRRLVVSFVSQGLQVEVLKESVRRAHELLTSMDINHEIEIVIDSAQVNDPLFEALECVVVEVPRTFSTKSGARFKARSLCYAAHARFARYQEKKNVGFSTLMRIRCSQDKQFWEYTASYLVRDGGVDAVQERKNCTLLKAHRRADSIDGLIFIALERI
jgi:hypothetical protein